MNVTLAQPALATIWRIVLSSSVVIGLAAGPAALAKGGGGGGHGGGGHGGGGHGGGGHVGSGGFGWGGGYRGGGYHRYGGHGYGYYYPSFFGFGGFGYGYPWYGYGYGNPGYGYLGYGYDAYPGYGYGSGYYYPGYYVDPGAPYTVNSSGNSGYLAAPNSVYAYSSAYGSVPRQATSVMEPASFPLPSLGIDERAVGDAAGSHIQVTRVHAGSPAERAGLQVGDAILSANRFQAQQPGNLAWIIEHHAPNGVLTLNVQKAANGQQSRVTVPLH